MAARRATPRSRSSAEQTGQMITGTAPPSTDHAAPATFEAASEHRNTITFATSRAAPVRMHARSRSPMFMSAGDRHSTERIRNDSAMATAAPIIRTEALTKVYDGADFAAVDGLDLTVRPREIFGLLGPNGAGKTTTAGMLTTRVIPTGGSAFVGEVDVIAQP